MESFIDFDSIIRWVITISTLGGLALLVKHQQKGWLLLFLPLLWYLSEDLFDDRTSGVLT
ncbi:MAG: hypothetical protein GY810_10975 [Aureispira sp.]|nr:hypothetical protein [Aureispira sp.]